MILQLAFLFIISPCIDADFDGVCYPIDCDDHNDELFYLQDFYLDEDHDGYGTGGLFYTICWGEGGYYDYPRDEASITNDDCEDLNPFINPGAREIPGNNIDENCDGVISNIISPYQRHNT